MGEDIRTAALAPSAEALRAALAGLVAIRPSNWDDDEDAEQAAAWRAADAALAGCAATAAPLADQP